jgi:hypothetical protein
MVIFMVVESFAWLYAAPYNFVPDLSIPASCYTTLFKSPHINIATNS